MNQNTLKFIVGLVVTLFIVVTVILVYKNLTGRTENTNTVANNVATNTVANNVATNSEPTNNSPKLFTSNSDVTNTVQPTEKTPPTLTGSNPKPDEIVTSAPLWVVATFSKEIHPSSTLRVVNAATKKDVGTGETKFSSDKKSMTLNVNIETPGSYSVLYSICNMQKVECASDQYTFTYSGSSN